MHLLAGVILPVMMCILSDHTFESFRSVAISYLQMSNTIPGVIFVDGEVAIRNAFKDVFKDKVHIRYDHIHLKTEVFKKHTNNRPKLRRLLDALMECEDEANVDTIVRMIKENSSAADRCVLSWGFMIHSHVITQSL